MIFIKDDKKKLKTLKDISLEYKIPLQLIQGRYNQGFKTIEELTRPKYYNFK